MEKECSKCGIKKPLTIEFFGRGKENINGFKSACKQCRNVEKNKYREANKERINLQAKQYHVNNREKRLTYWRKYNEENRDKRSIYLKGYYEKNKEKITIYQKEHYQRPEIKEAKRKYRQTYFVENKEKIYNLQREWKIKNKTRFQQLCKERRERPEVKQYYKEYRQSEQGRQTSKRSKHKRRSLERETLSTFTLIQWKVCSEKFNHKCAYCGKNDANNLTQDHFIPVSKGGEYTIKNVIPACLSCNSSKRDKDFIEWYSIQPFYSTSRERQILKYLGYKDKQQQIALF